MAEHIGQNLQPFTGNGEWNIFEWDKQTNKQTNINDDVQYLY